MKTNILIILISLAFVEVLFKRLTSLNVFRIKCTPLLINKIKTRLLIFVFFLFSVAAEATTYYISATGNNAYTGTSINNAWLSLSKISGINFSAGDSVLLEGGSTFNGTINFNNVTIGSSLAPVVFSSYGKNRATVNSGTNSGFYSSNSSGFILKNINFVGAGYTNTTNTPTGIYLRNSLPAGTKLNYIVIDSVDVSGYNINGITWTGTNIASGYSKLRITHSKIHDNGNGIVSGGVNGKTGYNITSWASDDVYIAYCEVYNNFGSPQVNNTHTGDGILVRSTNNLLIEHCLSHHNGSRSNTYTGGGCVGIWSTQCNNVIIQHCEAHHIFSGTHIDGDGFDLDGANTNAVLQYNYSHDNDGAGFLIYQYNNAGRMDSVIIRYNISENDSRYSNMGSIHLNSGDTVSVGGVGHALVYNNTIFLTPNSLTGTNSIAGGIVAKGTITSLTVANNIIQTSGGVPLVANTNNIPALFAGNLYWGSGSAFSVKWKNINYLSLASWQTSTSQEMFNSQATGIFADPLLANPGQDIFVTHTDSLAIKLTNYYTIANDSPAREAACYDGSLGLPRMAVDFFNKIIPAQGAIEIGAAQSNIATGTGEIYSYPLKIYPNPANDQLSFSEMLKDFEVFNMNGQVVIPNTQTASSISVQALSDGIYFIRTQRSTMKFIVHH